MSEVGPAEPMASSLFTKEVAEAHSYPRGLHAGHVCLRAPEGLLKWRVPPPPHPKCFDSVVLGWGPEFAPITHSQLMRMLLVGDHTLGTSDLHHVPSE